jgi:hypothetical protein
MKQDNVQIKSSTFTKMFYLSCILPAMHEQGDIVLTEQIYNDLLLVQDDLVAKMDAIKARQEYTQKLKDKK